MHPPTRGPQGTQLLSAQPTPPHGGWGAPPAGPSPGPPPSGGGGAGLAVAIVVLVGGSLVICVAAGLTLWLLFSTDAPEDPPPPVVAPSVPMPPGPVEPGVPEATPPVAGMEPLGPTAAPGPLDVGLQWRGSFLCAGDEHPAPARFSVVSRAGAEAHGRLQMTRSVGRLNWRTNGTYDAGTRAVRLTFDAWESNPLGVPAHEMTLSGQLDPSGHSITGTTDWPQCGSFTFVR